MYQILIIQVQDQPINITQRDEHFSNLHPYKATIQIGDKVICETD